MLLRSVLRIHFNFMIVDGDVVSAVPDRLLGLCQFLLVFAP